MLKTLALCGLMAGLLPAVELRVATFNIGAHFDVDEDRFVYGLNLPGTVDHDSVAAVLNRIDADVVALQELHLVDLTGQPSSELQQLATTVGLPYIYAANQSGSIDPFLRVAFLSRYPLLEMQDVTSPPGAKEWSRHAAAIKVDVPGTDRDPVLINAHFKSGGGTVDRFRRTVEMRRMLEFLSAEALEDSDPFVILGDFNPSGADRVYDEVPSGLPQSYVLGPDVTLPIAFTADTLSYFVGPVPFQLDPRQLNGSPATFENNTSVLDLIFVSPAIANLGTESEIYRSSLDVSNAAGLLKSGTPLNDASSTDASDHYAVFADLELNERPSDYALNGPGSQISEDFDGYVGVFEPALWRSNAAVWQGVDDGSSAVRGARTYGSVADGAVGFLADEDRYFETEITNDGSEPITVLDVSWQAEQWRSANAGSEDSIEVELEYNGVVTPISGLSHLARTDLPDGEVSGGEVTPLSSRVSGLSILPGDTFILRFQFVTGLGSSPPPAEVFVNEFHYDNTSSDTGEFVEVVVGPGFQGALTDVDLLLYNGNGGGTYGSTHGLETFVEGDTTASGHQLYYKMISGIQNGPDGFAVVIDGVAESFISYEGSFTATGGAASGMASVDVGEVQSTSNPVGTDAVSLVGSGGSASDFVWDELAGVVHSPGQVNAGQSLVVPGLPPQGLAVDDVSVLVVLDTDLDGVADDEDTDDDNDSMSDADELAFGSDPLDASSRFTIELRNAASSPALAFHAATGISYIVETSEDLSGWTELQTILGTGMETEVPVPAGDTRRFVRVRAGE